MRLIDADEARENILKLLDHHLMMRNYSADSATQDCIEVINEAPTIDAVEAVHGKWIKISESCGIDVLECSVCHGVHPRYATSFCCDCGAKMDEVSE